MIDKKAINYYSSFYEVSKDLTKDQFYHFNMAIFKVMFFDEHIDTITFKDAVLNLLWKSIKHSIQSSVEGYCSKKNIPYDECFVPLTNPLTNPLDNKDNEEEKGKGEVQGKVQLAKTYEKESDFSLQHDTHYDNLSKEYKEALQVFIESMGLSYPFDDFVNSLQAKASYKYKNFVKTYRAWAKNHIPKQVPQQRMDISKLPEGVSLQDMLNEAGEQWEREQEQKQIGGGR
jgi:hypothetical protein